MCGYACHFRTNTFVPGMKCPVSGCCPVAFPTHVALWRHWCRFHKPQVEVHVCERCQKSFSRRCDAVRHIRTVHDDNIKKMVVRNRQYIQPVKATMPGYNYAPAQGCTPDQENRPPTQFPTLRADFPSQPPSFGLQITPYSCPTSSARALAREERRRIAEEAAHGPLAALENRNSSVINRDEVAILRGSRMYVRPRQSRWFLLEGETPLTLDYDDPQV